MTGVCEQLAAHGHDVEVATGFPHYPWWSRQERGIARTEQINGVTVRRRTHYVPRRPTLARRGLYEASLAAAGLAGLPATRPDAIIAIVPSQADAVVARIAATVYRRRYGIVFQDLMGVAATQVGAVGETRAGGAIARLELSLARRAAAIAIVTEGYRPYLVDGGVDPKRIMRVYNWAEYTAPAETRERTRQRLGWAETEVVCLYAGSLGYKQGLETLVDTATHLNGDSLRIVFAGDGSEKARSRPTRPIPQRPRRFPATVGTRRIRGAARSRGYPPPQPAGGRERDEHCEQTRAIPPIGSADPGLPRPEE